MLMGDSIHMPGAARSSFFVYPIVRTFDIYRSKPNQVRLWKRNDLTHPQLHANVYLHVSIMKYPYMGQNVPNLDKKIQNQIHVIFFIKSFH